jgi:hypothetical protein
MQGHSFTRYATLAALVAALACARNPEPDDPDQSAAAQDTTAAQDTLTGQADNPAGYQGMDTTQTPSDTFLQNQGQGTPQDTAGYSGMERSPDTTGQTDQQTQPGQIDTTGVSADTTGTGTWSDTTSQTTDSVPSGDTTGYDQSQQADSTNQ